MKLITENPYRIIGLLVGVSAREQERQVRRLRQLVEAEQEPEEDFSFPILGQLHRTTESIEEASAKLNLDRDKLNAALFWFYKGNSITDEPALDALKEADLEQGLNIWTKLISNGEVTKRNASAYSNLGTLYLSGILKETYSIEVLFEKGITLKLKFLESDSVKDFKALTTDETFKTTKKELQLFFLNQLQLEVEKYRLITINKFLDILLKRDFSAKEDFFKEFIQKLINQIEHKIEIAKNIRKSSVNKADDAGRQLFTSTLDDLKQLKCIIRENDLKYISIADKVANEILQCSIEYFNDQQEKDSSSDYEDSAMKLAKLAEKVAVGKLTVDRVKDSIATLNEMKDRELIEAITFLQSIKSAYEDACSQIDKQVEELQYQKSEHQGRELTLYRSDVIIDWRKVNEMKKNCLSWDKVTDFVINSIPVQNIKKIKKSDNEFKINEYKELVNFLFKLISYSNENKISYLKYWEPNKNKELTKTPKPKQVDTPKSPTNSIPSNKNTNSSSSQSEFEFIPNAWWILGLVGLIIGVMAGGGVGAVVGTLVGTIIGSNLND